jgi:transposase-like protein
VANTTVKQKREKVGRPMRWSANKKVEVVLRLLRGESLDALSRETGLPASTLSEWRDAFVETGRAGLKNRSQDPVAEATEDERKRLLAKIGELSMDVEILRIANKVLQDREGPFVPRKSKP